MLTKLEDLDALERRLLHGSSGSVDLPAGFVARMIHDLREAERARARADELITRADCGRLGGEEW